MVLLFFVQPMEELQRQSREKRGHDMNSTLTVGALGKQKKPSRNVKQKKKKVIPLATVAMREKLEHEKGKSASRAHQSSFYMEISSSHQSAHIAVHQEPNFINLTS